MTVGAVYSWRAGRR